uniref:leucine-rich repeat and death domain-containing protein 1-like n=1 Tax=Anopheles coluzzii TaxID=1518534 RepID=UPI0020FF87A0|nr:leucine-rich repeat and death domain-containing protein 1-like [Anopheles coluzzii]
MTSNGESRLRNAFTTRKQVSVNKMIVRNSASGPFLHRFNNLLDSVVYHNYREAIFHLPNGSTITEITVWRAPAMRAFVAGSNAHLKVLSIAHCSLARIPITLPQLTTLKSLSIGDCKLTSFKLDMVLANQMLTTLNMCCNEIRQLVRESPQPHSLKILPNLEYFILYKNKLTQLDLSYFESYPNLTNIDISNNQITTVRTSSPVRLSVVHLNLMQNQLTTFNITGCIMPNITSLLLTGNPLTVIPPVFDNYPNMHLVMSWHTLICETLLPLKEQILSSKLKIQSVHASQCTSGHFYLSLKKMQECCGQSL